MSRGGVWIAAGFAIVVLVAGSLVHDLSCRDRDARLRRLLRLVGLRPSDAEKYLHESSGVQRQPLGIARALATNPDTICLLYTSPSPRDS